MISNTLLNGEQDLQTEHERYLTEQIMKKPLFVIDYPKEIKAFYMKLNDDGKNCSRYGPSGSGSWRDYWGSQREERLDVLEKAHGRDGP